MCMSKLCTALLKRGFKGFQSNRFGRIGELSELIVEHWYAIEQFVNVIVDDHANKLVLAVYCYQKSPWFIICCEVATHFNKTVVCPLKEAIGIDCYKKKVNEYRSWDGLKKFFEQLIKNLENMSVPTDESAKSILVVLARSKRLLSDSLEFHHFLMEQKGTVQLMRRENLLILVASRNSEQLIMILGTLVVEPA